MVHVLLPFMVLSIASTLEMLDRRIEEAAAVLGAPPAKIFWHVTLPLSTEGIVTGSILVFGTTALSSDPATRGQFTVTGEGGQVVSISVPPGFSMSNGSASIPVLLSREGDGNQTLSNSPGTAGTFSVYVGGAFVISNATASGVYSGTYTVNVDYN